MNIKKLAVVVYVFFSVVGSATAQDRMPAIPRDKMTEAQKKVADELIAGRRGALEGPFIPLLRSPEFMSRLQKMGEYLRYDNSFGTKLTEFLILVTARQWTQQYEWDVHYPLALKAGVKPDLLKAVSDGRHPAGMAEDEEIVYDFAAELRQNQGVSDYTYSRAVKKFGEQGVVEMTGVTGYYTMLGMIMNVARTPISPEKTPPLTPFPQ